MGCRSSSITGERLPPRPNGKRGVRLKRRQNFSAVWKVKVRPGA